MANEGFIIFKNKKSAQPSRGRGKTLDEIFRERAEQREEYKQMMAGKSMTRDEKALDAIEHMTRDEAEIQRQVGALPDADKIRKEMQSVAEVVEKKRDLGILQSKD